MAFILAPLFFGMAFITHPNLLSLEIGGEVSAKVEEFHNNNVMHFGHFVMLLSVPLLIVAAAKFMSMLKGRGAWPGFIGGVSLGHSAGRRRATTANRQAIRIPAI